MLLLVAMAQAQFQFFEQMFGGHQQHQHQQRDHHETQNVPSDSEWYQQSWAGGKLLLEVLVKGSLMALTSLQLTAATICAPAPCPASTSLTIVRVRFPTLKRRLSWVREALFACQGGDSNPAKQRGRSSWQGKGFYNAISGGISSFFSLYLLLAPIIVGIFSISVALYIKGAKWFTSSYAEQLRLRELDRPLAHLPQRLSG